MGCGGCQSSVPNGGDYLRYASCSQAAPQPLTDVNTMRQFAAQAGASSNDFTMCLALTTLYTRRLVYYKTNPGDCGTAGFNLASAVPQLAVAKGVGSAAALDPEPISKGILTGLAAIFGGFGAAHAQAVATEETTLCNVSAAANQTMVALETAVENGQLTPDQAAQILAQVGNQLDSVMASIAKPCNASCGYRIALRALVTFMTDLGFPTLGQAASPFGLSLAPPPTPSPGAPGTYGQAGATTPLPGVPVPGGTLGGAAGPIAGYPVPTNFPGSSSFYVGASGPSAPLTANNAGVGATLNLPAGLPIGTLVLIGGVIYVLSKSGGGKAAAAAAG